MPPVLAIVIPCYNEQEALPLTVERLLRLLDSMGGEGLVAPESYILCCNDGSTDGTWGEIERLHALDNRVKGISLAANCGHQYALMAGLMSINGHCDISISIDADLQDDPEAMREMVKLYGEGYDIVYGVRKTRSTDSRFKRATAHAFYRLQKKMGIDIVYDHADYRLLSDKALTLLSEYGEANLYLRGIIPRLGLRSATVEYVRLTRNAGSSKYPLSKMLNLSVDGITSFSTRPMRLIFLTGVSLLLTDIVVALYVFISYFFNTTISGWTSLMISIWFLGSLILMGLGIIGEYIGKIYLETKHRPRYAITQKLT